MMLTAVSRILAVTNPPSRVPTPSSTEGPFQKSPKFYRGITSEDSKILLRDRIRRVQNSIDGPYQKSPKFY